MYYNRNVSKYEPDYTKLNPKDVVEDYLTTSHERCTDQYTFSLYKLAEFKCINSSLESAKIIVDNNVTKKKRVNNEFGYYSTRKINKKTDFTLLGDYISIDVETTGRSPSVDRIIEISAIKFIHFAPVEVFTTYINPKKRIPKKIEELTGIENWMVEDEPTFPQIASCFADYIYGSNLVFHNSRFDLAFLHYQGISIDTDSQSVYDTLELARKHLRDEEGKKYSSYSLDVACAYRNINIAGSHCSQSDALASGLLFNEIVKVVSGNENLLSLYND